MSIQYIYLHTIPALDWISIQALVISVVYLPVFLYTGVDVSDIVSGDNIQNNT